MRLSALGKSSRSPGQIIVIVAVIMTILLGLVGSGVDYGLLLVERTHIQQAADAAALSGARALVSAPTPGAVAAAATATEYLRLNGYQQGVLNTNITYAFATPTPTGPVDRVQIRVVRVRPTMFWRVFGINTVTVSNNITIAQAGGGGPADVVLAVDETNRMGPDMNEVRAGALAFINRLDPGLGARVAMTQFRGTQCPTGDGVWAWGRNTSGQIGIGDTGGNPVPSPALVIPPGVTTVSAGGSHSMVLMADSTIKVWGENQDGQLGLGDTTDRSSPAALSLTNVADISAGGSHSLALMSNNTIKAWGKNDRGQLTSAGGSGSPSPVDVSLPNVIAISAGENHSLALVSGPPGLRNVRAWGADGSGQLGDGLPLTDSSAPVEPNLRRVTAISAGGRHSLALDRDNDVWAWGNNTDGQSGPNAGSGSASPVLVFNLNVPGPSGATSIAAGGRHSLAVKSDGTVWAWGDNTSGQLGNVTAGSRSSTPVQVTGLTGVTKIAASGRHSLALKSDGTVWAWGSNDHGQIGTGLTGGQVSTPVVIASLIDAARIDAGNDHSLALSDSPCLSDAHAMTKLTGAQDILVHIVDGSSTGCPPLPDPQPPNTTPPGPGSTPYRCQLQSGGSPRNRYIKTGFEATFMPGQWNLWAPPEGRPRAKKFLVLVTGGANEFEGPGAVPVPEANARTVEAANAAKRGADGLLGTADDVEVYIVGYFSQNESSLTQPQPRCAGPTFPPPGPPPTTVDIMLRDASSSTSGSCDHYFPLDTNQNLPQVMDRIASLITWSRLIE